MEYQADAGTHGLDSGVMYFPQDAAFVGGQGLGYGKNEALCVVPVCRGSGSSEASDDGTLLRLPFAEMPRCDSSRSETGESSCSSASEEDALRVPMILPPGYVPHFPAVSYPPGLLRVSQKNGMRFVKPGEPVDSGGLYYLKPQAEVPRSVALQGGTTLVTKSSDISVADPSSVYYVKHQENRTTVTVDSPQRRGETQIVDPGGIYYLKQPGEPNRLGQFVGKPGQQQAIDAGGIYYVKASTESQRLSGPMIKPGDPITDPSAMYYFGSAPEDTRIQALKPIDQSFDQNGVYYVKGAADRAMDPNAIFYMKPPNDNNRVASADPNAVYYVKAPNEILRSPPVSVKPTKFEVGVPQPVLTKAPPMQLPEKLQPVPHGWRRLLVDNTVIYLSPSNVALSTMDEVKIYLQSPGTCKCGLECPLLPDLIFNFNPKVASQAWNPSDSEMTKLCNHKRKFDEASPPANVVPVPVEVPPEQKAVASPTKKKKKKQPAYAGVSVSQLLAQRERERALAASGGNQPRWPTPYPIMRPPDPIALFPSRPPWQQRKPLAAYERVPPLQQHMPPPAQFPVAIEDPMFRKKHKPKRKTREPTFMDDPNGYLAQQTALLHNTIARPNYGVPLPSNVLLQKKAWVEERGESPVTSTVPSDPRPIQGGTVSTSNASPPLCTPPAQSPGNVLVSSSLDPSPGGSKPSPPNVPHRKNQLEMVQTVMSNMQTSTSNGHILLSGTGQYLSGLKLSQTQSLGTVLVNAMPAPFVIQPGVMAVDTGLGLVAGNVLVDPPPALLSPDKKKKGKKRKGAALGSPVLQVPPPGNMLVNQGFGGVQALTLVQGKPMVVNNPINVMQPMVQQLLVPGLGNMVMATASDGTTALLPDPGIGQLQLQPMLTNTSFITTPAGMLIRSPNSLVGQVSPPEYIQILPQTSAAVVQQNTTIVQQQTTMMTNLEKPPLELEIVASAETQHSVSTQTSVSKETSHTFCQTVGSPPPVVDTTTDDLTHVSSSVADDYLSPSAHDDSVIGSQTDDRHRSPSYLNADMNRLGTGDLIWGAARGSLAWPGQIVGSIDDKGYALVKWFGGVSSASTRVLVSDLQTLSEGLEAHHKASNSARRTRKLRSELEAAIQEAMLALDKMAASTTLSTNGRSRRSQRQV